MLLPPQLEMAKKTTSYEGGREFKLKINDLKPDVIPMNRLAEYMMEFARLLGSRERVHFNRLDDGSTVLVSQAEEQEEPKISRRLELVRLNGGIAEAKIAFKKLDDMLAEDNTSGTIFRGASNVIEFPGRNRPRPDVYETASQNDSIDGVLIAIGGRDSTVPAHLRDHSGNIQKCNTSIEIARRIAPYLFGSTLRVFGQAEWKRDEQGSWTLSNLVIEDFVELTAEPTAALIDRLRAVPGNYWHQEKDPHTLLNDIRYGDEGDEKAS